MNVKAAIRASVFCIGFGVVCAAIALSPVISETLGMIVWGLIGTTALAVILFSIWIDVYQNYK